MPTREELIAQLDEDRARIQELDAQYAGRYMDPQSDDGREWTERNQRIDDILRTLDQLERRAERIRELANGPDGAREGGESIGAPNIPRPGVARGDSIYDLSTVRASATDPTVAGREMRERALRSIDQAKIGNPQADPDEAKAHIERMVRDGDNEQGSFARYLLSTGSPTYRRAFRSLLMGRQLTREEQVAVAQAQAAERAMSLTGSAGGYAVPYVLDPTVLLTSNGTVNPIRSIARVETIAVDEWRGLTSAGITAGYAAEATEASDNAPTFAQPTVSTEKAFAFVPFSIEIGMDWPQLESEIALMLQDARDTLEATKFISGTGTNEPQGVLVGATNTVTASPNETFTLTDLYALVAALPPRYRANGRFLADLLIYQAIRQFDDVGSGSKIWVDSLQAGEPPILLGKPAHEASEMPNTHEENDRFMVFGDFSRYLIVDRVGMTIELVPHLVGTNHRPTGQRGIYAYWRNGAKVIDANAFRVLIGSAPA